MQPVATLEADSFCDCGYNLHSQSVWRDERLGILICRCPECGRHSAAGKSTGVATVWLARLSGTLLIAWVLGLLGLYAVLTVLLGVWPGSHLSQFTTMAPIPNQSPNAASTIYELQFNDPSSNYISPIHQAAIFVGLASLTGIIVGICTSVFQWHLKKRRYYWLLLPVLSGSVVLWIFFSTPMADEVRAWIPKRIAAYVAVEMAGIAIGACIGRSVARFVLTLLLPDKLLQHLAFLWYRDGKELRLKKLEPKPQA